MKPHTESCTIIGLPCEVEFNYWPADNGYPEYPDSPEEYEILSVTVVVFDFDDQEATRIDITAHISGDNFADIEQQLEDKRCCHD
jgi:hypothetical protein